MLRIALVGDLVLDEPDADHWLSGIAPALLSADLAIGHLEVPHSDCFDEMAGDVPAPGAPPANIGAISRAGIKLVSLAGNHMADLGPQGIRDTIQELDRNEIAHCGAGEDLAAAKAAAVAAVEGRRIALLSFNCVGPEAGWAGPCRAGFAYLPMITADGSAVAPAKDILAPAPPAFAILEEEVAAAREIADFVIVALHKGLVHTPVKLAPYERQIAQAAIAAGADAVASHHSHIIRGIEFFQGRPIFHGLGNGCVVTRALAPDQAHSARAEWARRRREIFGFEPDPAYHLAPFHPEAVNAFIGVIGIADDGKIDTGLVPVYVEPPGRPVLAGGEQARVVMDYVQDITKLAGLPSIRIDDDGAVRAAA